MQIRLKLVVAASLSGMLFSGGLAMEALAAPTPYLFASDESASTQDASFLKRSIVSNHAAIEDGNIVLKKTSNDRLKQIAQTVVDTHTKMLEQLVSASKSAGVAVPDGVSPTAKTMSSKLKALNGKALDKAFTNDMIKLHNAELQMFQLEANEGTSAPLKKLSQDELPIIQQHLTDLHGIQKNGL